MGEIIRIAGKEIVPVEYEGQRVLTLRQVDEIHQRPLETAGRNFRENKDRLIEGEDYFYVPYEEWSKWETARRNSSGGGDTGQRNPLIALTETGYLLLVKSFTDDLAWQVQRMLVKVYFRAKEEFAAGLSAEAPTMSERLALGVLRGEGTDAQRVEMIHSLVDSVSRKAFLAQQKKRIREIADTELLHTIKACTAELARRAGDGP